MQFNQNTFNYCMLFFEITLLFVSPVQNLQSSEVNRDRIQHLKIDLALVKESHQEVAREQRKTLCQLKKIAIKNKVSLEEAKKVLKKRSALNHQTH